jgi:dipeptidyl-peptidase 4
VRNASITPHWTGDGDRFWYERQETDGTTSIIEVDPAARARRELGQAPPAPAVPAGRLRSPDGRWDLTVGHGNLFIAGAGESEFRALTTDGDPDYGYAIEPGSSLVAVTNRRTGSAATPAAVWSPDSRRIVTHRLDQRNVPEQHLLEYVPPTGFRPVLHRYRMAFAGDPLATAELVVIDAESGAVTHLAADPLLVEFLSPLELGWVWWGSDASTIWFLREARGATRLALCAADAGGRFVREVIVEASNDYVEPHPLLPWPRDVRLVRGEGQVVWPSERDGWRHLYLFDAASGELVRRLTGGEWMVRDILAADDDWVWFTGLGRDPGIDPYFRIVYRVSLDGGEPQQLTGEAADHLATFSPSGGVFVDVASTASTAPVARCRRSDGGNMLGLETADLSDLEAEGWRPPERFSVKAGDGHSDLYGALFVPSDFDPGASYPVIDSIYPGPQLIRTPVAFGVAGAVNADEWPGQWSAQALAELGFVVVTVDPRGSTLRDRAFHHASVGCLEDYGLDDHIATIRALAAQRPWMDLDRVGIAGHSGGGAAAVRAVIERGDFFKAAAAGSGNHDLRRYLAYWAEKYQGYGPQADLDATSNADQAHRVERPLLLLHGDVDDNVHPANTLALVDALVRADRDFELVIIPGASHQCDGHPYYVRRVWDFFVRHLLGRTPPSRDARRRAAARTPADSDPRPANPELGAGLHR